jgi:hypothetical protein
MAIVMVLTDDPNAPEGSAAIFSIVAATFSIVAVIFKPSPYWSSSLSYEPKKGCWWIVSAGMPRALVI